MNKYLVRAEVDLEVDADNESLAEKSARQQLHPSTSQGITIVDVQITSVELD